MINFLSLDGAKFYLKQIQLTGIKSWEKLLRKTLEVWLPHIKETQLPHLASGITGIRSIVNIGTGIADLVLLPIEQFKKDGRIFRGIFFINRLIIGYHIIDESCYGRISEIG